MRLAHGLLDLLRIGVQDELGTFGQAEVGPSAFEDMGKGEEAHHAILLTDGHTLVVGRHGCVVLTIGKDDALRVACGATGIDDVANIVHRSLVPELLHLRLTRQILAQRNEILKIEGVGIVAGDAYGMVEDNDTLERWAQWEHTVCLVVLLLLADEQESHVGIVHHILNLLFARCGVDGYRHHTDAIGAEIGVHVLNAVLCEHGNVLLRLYAEIEHGIRHLLHAKRELFPGNSLPF